MSSKRWTSDEKIKLMELYSDGLSYDEIGEKLNRSSNAIKLRLESIVYDNLIKGQPIKVLSRTLNTDADKIIQMYYSHKSFKQSRGETVVDIDISKNNLPNNASNNNVSNVSNVPNDNSIFRENNDNDIKKHDKMKKIEYENRILEAVLKNYQMKKQLRKLYIDGKIDKKNKGFGFINDFIK